MLQFAHMFRPGLFRGLGISRQLVSHRFRHKLAERNSPLGRLGLGPPKTVSGISNVVFMTPLLRYLWEAVDACGKRHERLVVFYLLEDNSS